MGYIFRLTFLVFLLIFRFSRAFLQFLQSLIVLTNAMDYFSIRIFAPSAKGNKYN